MYPFLSGDRVSGKFDFDYKTWETVFKMWLEEKDWTQTSKLRCSILL